MQDSLVNVFNRGILFHRIQSLLDQMNRAGNNVSSPSASSLAGLSTLIQPINSDILIAESGRKKPFGRPLQLIQNQEHKISTNKNLCVIVIDKVTK